MVVFFFIIKIKALLLVENEYKTSSIRFFIYHLITYLNEVNFVDFSGIFVKKLKQDNIKNIYEFNIFIGIRSVINNPLEILYQLAGICRTFLDEYNNFLQIFGIFLIKNQRTIKQTDKKDLNAIFTALETKHRTLYWTIYSPLHKNLHHSLLYSLQRNPKIRIQIKEIYNPEDVVLNYKTIPGFCFLKKYNLDESKTALHEHFIKLYLYIFYRLDYNKPFEEHHIKFLNTLHPVEKDIVLDILNDFKSLEKSLTNLFKFIP